MATIGFASQEPIVSKTTSDKDSVPLPIPHGQIDALLMSAQKGDIQAQCQLEIC